MSQLPTREDLLRRKALERDELARPHKWAAIEQQEVATARARYWELLGEFVLRARELGVAPATRQSPADGVAGERIMWVEGYPLTSGIIVSAPPLRYCISERRLLLRPEPRVLEVDQLAVFVLGSAGAVEQHTPVRGTWPPVFRLDQTAVMLTALQRELEASLLALMD